MSTRGGSTLLLEELGEQAFGGLLVAPALDENVENEPVLVDGTPKIVLLAADADEHLILSANSGDRCQSGEAGHACFGPRRST